MRVKVRFTGLIRHHLGDKERDFELPEGSRLGDLLKLVGREYASRMPDQMWDADKESFHPLIVAMRKGEPSSGADTPLRDGDEIYLLSRMAGG